MSTQPWEGEELAPGWSPPSAAPAWAELAGLHLHTGNRETLILEEPEYAGLNRGGDAKPKGGVGPPHCGRPAQRWRFMGEDGDTGICGQYFVWQSQVEGQRGGA